jgi:hypothetical protein
MTAIGSAVLALVAATSFAARAAGPPLVPGQWKVVKAHALAPSGIHEECVDLEARERIEYAFASGAPVAFNIHYHEGNAVIQPISRDGTREERGELEARVPQTYCLMWEAGREATTLDYRFRLLGPRR